MKSVFVFCEGRHDVVFAQRCLGALGGCSWIRSSIGDLPSPLGANSVIPQGLIASWYQHASIEKLGLQEAAHPPSPSVRSIVNNEEKVFVLIGMNGKDRIEGVMRILQQLRVVFRRAETGKFDVSQYATAFLFDADDRGLEETLDWFRLRYEAHFGDMPDLEHGKWITGNDVPVGCFVFHDDDAPTKTGTLETHVAPMAKGAWPDRFRAAMKFVDDNAREGDSVHGDEAKRMKAIITSAGQFDNPGSPLSEIIGRNGLPGEQFERSPASRELAEFLTAAP